MDETQAAPPPGSWGPGRQDQPTRAAGQTGPGWPAATPADQATSEARLAGLGAPGRRIGQYEVVEELGRGGMGVVLVVRHPEIPRPLALKLIIGDATGEALARFGREAQVLARIRHRNVVQIHQVGRAAEGPFIVTELVEGKPLDRLVAQGGPLEPEEAARIVRELADGLAACHAAGVIHRDLKPANVLLREDGSPVVLDFGVARDETAERLTRTGQVIGTPAYMAPEQADGTPPAELDGRVDVYGLGAILYTLLGGKQPFEGQADSFPALLKKVLLEDPTWPRALRPEVPAEVDAIVRAAMAKQREGRHRTAAALREDLDKFLRGERPWAASHLPAPAGRRRGLVAAGALLVAAIGAAIALRAPPPPSPFDGQGEAAVISSATPAPTASELAERAADRAFLELEAAVKEFRAGKPGFEAAALLRAFDLDHAQHLGEGRRKGLLDARAALHDRPLQRLAHDAPPGPGQEARGLVLDDGQVLVYCADGLLQVWRLGVTTPTMSRRTTLEELPADPSLVPPQACWSAAANVGGGVLVAGHTVALLRAPGYAPAPWAGLPGVGLLRSAGFARALAVDAQRRLVAVGGGRPYPWENQDPKEPAEIARLMGAVDVLSLPDGGVVLNHAPRPSRAVFSLLFAEGRLFVGTGAFGDGFDELTAIRPLNVATGEVGPSLRGLSGVPRALVDAGGGRIVAGMASGQVRVFRLGDPEANDQFEDPAMKQRIPRAHAEGPNAALLVRDALLTGSIGGYPTGKPGWQPGGDLRRWRLEAVGAPPASRTVHEVLRGKEPPCGITSLDVTKEGYLVVGRQRAAVEVWLLPPMR